MFRTEPPSARALTGVRVVVLRAEGRGGPLVVALSAAGATVTELSLMSVQPLSPALLGEAVARLEQYAWVLLTSAHAVSPLETALHAARLSLGARKLAVVGDATLDAVDAAGWAVTVHPARRGIDGLIDAMAERNDVEGAPMLYPSAPDANDALATGLRALGAQVDIVPVYCYVPDLAARARLREMVADSAIDVITVSAPGTMDALLEAIPPEHVRRVPVACVGPMAARAARRAGFPVKVEAENPSPSTLVRRIVAAFRPSR